MFTLKKILGHLLFPVPLLCLCLLLGVLALLCGRVRWAKGLLIAAVCDLVLAGFQPFPHAMIAPLEHMYAPLNPGHLKKLEADAPAIQYIVVLGGGKSEAAALPAVSRLSSASLARVTESVRLSRQLPAARLLYSGGKPFSITPEAVVMAQAAETLGVSHNRIILEDQSLDTDDQARLIKPMVGSAPFVLVTSASHMPRAMGLFRHYGMAPIAAPTDYLSPEAELTGPLALFPSSNNFRIAERATYEYLGLAAAYLAGKMKPLD